MRYLAGLPCDRARNPHELRFVTDEAAQRWHEEVVMCAAEHDLIDPLVDERQELLVNFINDRRRTQVEGFYLGRPAVAGNHMDGAMRRMACDELRQPLAASRRSRGEHGDVAALGVQCCRLDAGFDADNRNSGMCSTQRFNGFRSGGVRGAEG